MTVAEYEFKYSNRNKTNFPNISTISNYEGNHYRSFKPSVVRSEIESLHSKKTLIAGRPKAALLFWFFSDFRCGLPLFIVIRIIYKNRNR